MSMPPSAALAIKPPTPGPDPIEQYSRLQGIRDLMQRQQLEQGQGQLQQQEIQKNQLALQDQNGLHQAMIDSGGDPDKLRAAITDPKYNITPNGAFSTIKMLNDYKQSQIALDQATRKDNIDSDSSIADRYQKIAQLPTDQQPSAVNDLKADKDFLKGLTPRGQQEIGGFQYNGPDSVTLMAHSHLTRQALDEQADKEANAAKSAAQTAEAAANTEKAKAETTNLLSGANPAMADARYRNIQAAIQQKQPVSADDKAFVTAYEKQKTLNPVATFNLQNQGATGTAGKPSAIAQGLADGTMKWQDVVSTRTPMSVKQALLSEVKGIKPDFNSGDFQVEQKVREEFTSGDAAKSLTAFNTAIEHAKQLQNASDYLDNGNTIALNKIGNALGYQFGSDKTTNFNVIKNALTGEISKVFKGGGATDAEIEAVQGPFSSANSPAQLKGAINNAVALMNSKRNALQQQYKQGAQAKPNFGTESQGAQQAGTRPTNVPANFVHIKASDGSTHWVPSLAAAQKVDPKAEQIQ